MTFDEYILKQAKIKANVTDEHWDIQSDAYKSLMIDEAYKAEEWIFMAENKAMMRTLVEKNWAINQQHDKLKMNSSV